jgi:dihydrolipoamide dehydrogenase
MAIQQKISYKVAVYSYRLVSRAIAMKATDGFVKLIVSNDDEMNILGVRVYYLY